MCEMANVGGKSIGSMENSHASYFWSQYSRSSETKIISRKHKQ